MVWQRLFEATWLLVLLASGCTKEHKILAVPPDGGVCTPIETDGSMDFPAERVDAGDSQIIGAPIRLLGRLSDCDEPAKLTQDAAACSDPSDLSDCLNPFGPDAGTESDRIKRLYGPCACLTGTLASDARSVNLLIEPDQQAALIESRPDAFAAIAGGWGRQGWTTMTLAEVSVAEAKSVLADAHALASAPPRKPKPKPADHRRDEALLVPADATSISCKVTQLFFGERRILDLREFRAAGRMNALCGEAIVPRFRDFFAFRVDARTTARDRPWFMP